ncbi:hypothetical protein [Ostreiculturibacter nitratireducens]|uniref:hypothetical protein n=1 Tax=Ostreiculturibacter nitratireducens TaxID=3075226 RepID=UPI0031B5E86B
MHAPDPAGPTILHELAERLRVCVVPAVLIHPWHDTLRFRRGIEFHRALGVRREGLVGDHVHAGGDEGLVEVTPFGPVTDDPDPHALSPSPP